jgi:hypothetical protein
MPSKSFRFSGVLGFGWNVMKSNFWFFVGVGVVSLLIPCLLESAGAVTAALYPKAITPFWIYVLVGVIYIISIILIIGFIRITLIFCDGRKPRFSTLFSGWDCFWRFFAAMFLYYLIIDVIALVCILPFVLLSDATRNPLFAVPILVVICILVVMLSIKFGLFFYFVIDKGLGPINALKASSLATAGAKWTLFVFDILCCLIVILGELCFIVGLFAAVPTVMVAMALVYRHLSEQTPELAELGISGPNVKPSARGGVGGSTQPFAGMQANPIIPSIQSIQSGPGIRLGQSVQLSQGVQPSQHIQPGEGIRPAPAIQPEGKKKSNNSLLWWVVALSVCVAIAAGISYYFLARAKGKVAVSPNGAKVSIKEVSLTGIIYSEDNSSAMIDGKIVKEGDIIDGITVVKINKNDVELEKDGVKWTQRARKATGS